VVADSVAEEIMSGLILILQKHREIVNSQTEWNIVLALIRSSISSLEAARMSFDFIQHLITDGPQQYLCADNVLCFVAVLDDFVAAAGIIVEVELQQARRRPQSNSSR
jgi:golgi-specific brefeldin A-resistance guanine nucleotide exchange factor 1